MNRRTSARDYLLLTCEHGGNRIPQSYARLFRDAVEVLASHRGWDPRVLPLARLLARKLDRPLLAITWSRLSVEANRTPSDPRNLVALHENPAPARARANPRALGVPAPTGSRGGRGQIGRHQSPM